MLENVLKGDLTAHSAKFSQFAPRKLCTQFARVSLRRNFRLLISLPFCSHPLNCLFSLKSLNSVLYRTNNVFRPVIDVGLHRNNKRDKKGEMVTKGCKNEKVGYERITRLEIEEKKENLLQKKR